MGDSFKMLKPSASSEETIADIPNSSASESKQDHIQEPAASTYSMLRRGRSRELL